MLLGLCWDGELGRAFGRFTASLGLRNRPMGWMENAESMFKYRCWGRATKDKTRCGIPWALMCL